MSTRASLTAIPIALGSFLPYTAVGSLGPSAEIMVRYGYRCAVMYTSLFFLFPVLLLFDGVETVSTCVQAYLPTYPSWVPQSSHPFVVLLSCGISCRIHHRLLCNFIYLFKCYGSCVLLAWARRVSSYECYSLSPSYSREQWLL